MKTRTRLVPPCGTLRVAAAGGGPLALDAADGHDATDNVTVHTYPDFPGVAPDKVAVRILVLGFSGLVINSVTYGGVALALEDSITASDGFRKAALYGRTGGLPTGSRDVVVT